MTHFFEKLPTTGVAPQGAVYTLLPAHTSARVWSKFIEDKFDTRLVLMQGWYSNETSSFVQIQRRRQDAQATFLRARASLEI